MRAITLGIVLATGLSAAASGPEIGETAVFRRIETRLEVMPSNRIKWGADCNRAEEIYGAPAVTRQVLAEVLAEKVARDELIEPHALRIGRQVLCQNAPERSPKIRERLGEYPEGPPEHGLGLTPADSANGWISLFDGETDFGWSAARNVGGVLTSGATTTELGPCELRAVVERPGTITAGGVDYYVKAGPWTLAETQRSGPIRLGAGAAISSLAARPLNLRTILEGGNLAGWTPIHRPGTPPARRARWETIDGVLRARGGPGSLEYDGRFGDVVLQVTARTRARHANAGVFFRSQPGALMNGYEAQVYNRCEENDPAKPSRYATGAIDDRQNARRLVSRDGRPFTLTVIARGPHLATWVNGHQVTDWTDTRPEHDNPREGLRLTPGTIQLQAHDAETDVEFRSVRVGTIDK